MDKRTTQNAILDGVESNIEATEREICRLQVEFSSLLIDGQTLERPLVLQQLHILQDNLHLLKVRRMYALETLH